MRSHSRSGSPRTRQRDRIGTVSSGVDCGFEPDYTLSATGKSFRRVLRRTFVQTEQPRTGTNLTFLETGSLRLTRHAQPEFRGCRLKGFKPCTPTSAVAVPIAAPRLPWKTKAAGIVTHFEGLSGLVPGGRLVPTAERYSSPKRTISQKVRRLCCGGPVNPFFERALMSCHEGRVLRGTNKGRRSPAR